MKLFRRKVGRLSATSRIPFLGRGLQLTLSIYFSLAAIAGMVILTLLITMRSQSNTKAILGAESERMVSQINVNLDLVLRDAMRISDGIYYRVLKKSDIGSAELTNDMKLIYESNMSSLASIGLFRDNGDLVLSIPYSHLRKHKNPHEEDWFKSAIKTIENVHFSQPYVQQIYDTSEDDYQWIVSLSRSVQLTENGSVSPGVLAVDMKYSQIEQIFKSIAVSGRTYLYLTDQSGNIIYHPRQQLIFSGISNENNFDNAALEEGVSTEQFLGEERQITVKTVGYTGWKIIAVDPLNDESHQANELVVYSLFIGLLTIFLVVLTNYVLSSHIAKPIKQLERAVLDLEQGKTAQFSPRHSLDSSPEIQHLSSAIEALVLQQEQLRSHILVEQESKRRSELEALQAQIHPHFLYNTLDSIIWMVENERYSGAVEMVTALAKFFRLSLAKGQNIITIQSELDQVRSYLTIQKVRYRNQFEYTIHCTEEVKNCATIKLIVQPLVENAILHGMATLDDEGEISISAYCKDAQLYIDVTDNGLGMTKAQAEALLSAPVVSKLSKNSKNTAGSGIGVANVNERIKLYFGDIYGLRILSVPDEGTTVRIHLPMTCKTNVELKPLDKK